MLRYLSALGLLVAAPAMAVNSFPVDTGQYREDGATDISNPNIFSGWASDVGDGDGTFEFRNYVVFDLSTAPTATHVSLVYQSGGAFWSPQATETITLFSFEGSIDDLINGTGGSAAFDDLGDGTVFGSYTQNIGSPTNSQGGDPFMLSFGIPIALNADFMTLYNSIAGTPGAYLAIGGTVTTLDRSEVFDGGGDEGFFAGSRFEPAAYLQIGNNVPEPATWAMMLIGFGLMGSALRRKRGQDERAASACRVGGAG